MNCLVVDDEPLARAGMAAYVSRTQGLSLVAACKSFPEAKEIIMKGQVQLLLLDIEMPGVNGLHGYRSLEVPPPVIFVTAFAEHALAGFDLQAMDYLLKPVTYGRFLKSIEVARQRIAQQPVEESLWLRIGTTSVRVKPSAIRVVEGMENYVCVYTTGGKLLALSTLQSLQAKLDARRFIRLHRSFIVNIDHVRSYRADRVVMDDREVPIGRKYRSSVREAFTAIDGL